jgi:hypothetical protein
MLRRSNAENAYLKQLIIKRERRLRRSAAGGFEDWLKAPLFSGRIV